MTVLASIAVIYILGGLGVFVVGMFSRSSDRSTRELESLLVVVAAFAWPLAIPIWLSKKFRK